MTEQPPSRLPEITIPYDQFQISAVTSWIECNGYKPHLVLVTGYPGVVLPPQCMAKQVEVINVHSKSTSRIDWRDDEMRFGARFGGREFKLVIPYRAIIAVQFAGTDGVVGMPWADVQHVPTPPQSVPQRPEPPEVQASTQQESDNRSDLAVLKVEGPTVRHVDFRAPRPPKK